MPRKRFLRSGCNTTPGSCPRTAPRTGSLRSPRAPGPPGLFGVPVESKALSGVDSLYSIVQMPPGVPVGTLAIGAAGAVNAALLAASVLALGDTALAERLEAWRRRQTEAVAERPEDDA